LNLKGREEIHARLPSYARGAGLVFPKWKQDFIRQNREFFASNKRWIEPLLKEIKEYPASHQKFEWNCKGEERNIWKYVIQFRASGVRVKRPTTAPSLVAMTTTQVPIIAWEKRYMTQRECSRLQCMGRIELPSVPTKAHKALGNAVNAEVVRQIAHALLGTTKTQARRIAA
jgi:DNA (cytosine-5)-methyltransferase 1